MKKLLKCKVKLKLMRVIFYFATLTTASRSGYAKHRLSKFKGIKKENFLLHLKETEFRYNVKIQGQDLYEILLKLIRNNPLKLF